MAGTERQGQVYQGEEYTATWRAGDGDRGRCARSGHARRCAARRRGIGRRGGKGGVALAGRGLLSRTRAQGWATRWRQRRRRKPSWRRRGTGLKPPRSEEHTSELQSLMRSSYAVFGLKKKKKKKHTYQKTTRNK